MPHLNVCSRLEVVKSSQMSKCTSFQHILSYNYNNLCFFVNCSSNLDECRANLCIVESRTIKTLPLEEFARKGIYCVNSVFLRENVLKGEAKTDWKEYVIPEFKQYLNL